MQTKQHSLIEDCAHSLGSTLDGNHSGLYGDAEFTHYMQPKLYQ